MGTKTNLLAPPMKYYSNRVYKYEKMLEYLPIDEWLRLNALFEQEHRHSVDIIMAIDNGKYWIEAVE